MNRYKKNVKAAPFGQLQAVLEKWVSLNMDRRGWDKDAPWWYNERASLSQFVGAIWRCKGWAFEEYAIHKQLPSGQPRLPGGSESMPNRGRVDVAFETPGLKAIAEVKQVWPTMPRQIADVRKRIEDELSGAFTKAHNQVRDYSAADHYRRLGIVFLAPRLRARELSQVDAFLEGAITACRRWPRCAVAWAFPESTRSTLRSSRNGYYYPGVIISIAEAP